MTEMDILKRPTVIIHPNQIQFLSKEYEVSVMEYSEEWEEYLETIQTNLVKTDGS